VVAKKDIGPSLSCSLCRHFGEVTEFLSEIYMDGKVVVHDIFLWIEENFFRPNQVNRLRASTRTQLTA
jgi:hypothetical protein